MQSRQRGPARPISKAFRFEPLCLACAPELTRGAHMSLSDLASLGSFVSGAAVLASLVFLFFQMRQMTEQVRQTERNQRATINQERIAQYSDRLLRWSEPSLAR